MVDWKYRGTRARQSAMYDYASFLADNSLTDAVKCVEKFCLNSLTNIALFCDTAHTLENMLVCFHSSEGSEILTRESANTLEVVGKHILMRPGEVRMMKAPVTANLLVVYNETERITRLDARVDTIAGYSVEELKAHPELINPDWFMTLSDYPKDNAWD